MKSAANLADSTLIANNTDNGINIACTSQFENIMVKLFKLMIIVVIMDGYGLQDLKVIMLFLQNLVLEL